VEKENVNEVLNGKSDFSEFKREKPNMEEVERRSYENFMKPEEEKNHADILEEKFGIGSPEMIELAYEMRDEKPISREFRKYILDENNEVIDIIVTKQ